MQVALKEAIESIKTAGFSHIKVELEADIGRDGEIECDNCYGDGAEDCYDCSGEGYIGTGVYTRISDEEVREECQTCYGDGRTDCDSCAGTGNCGNFMEEETCEEFMKDHVPGAVLDRLTYGRFYEDGSVDSEFTFTIPIEAIEDVPVWIEAFKALSVECGGRLDVGGAGLHIAVLPNGSGGRYPCGGHLDRAGIANFKSEMTKLLPALFFVASCGHQSRDLGYRHATIGEDKYHAISTGDDRWLEYRVFETCYDKPEAFYDYVKVIANSLKFYADSSLKVKALGKKFGFNDGDTLARFYNTPEQLRILNATIKHLKPRDKTYKKLKEERGVRYTISSLTKRERIKMDELRQEYREYRRHWVAANGAPLTERQEEDVNRLVMDGYNRNEAVDIVRGNQGTLMSLTQFISEQLVHNYDEVVAV